MHHAHHLQTFSVAWSTATITGTLGSITAQSEFKRFYYIFKVSNYDSNIIIHAYKEYTSLWTVIRQNPVIVIHAWCFHKHTWRNQWLQVLEYLVEYSLQYYPCKLSCCDMNVSDMYMPSVSMYIVAKITFSMTANPWTSHIYCTCMYNSRFLFSVVATHCLRIPRGTLGRPSCQEDLLGLLRAMLGPASRSPQHAASSHLINVCRNQRNFNTWNL